MPNHLTGTDGGFFRRNRIRFNSYFCLEAVTGSGARGRNTAWPHSVGTAVKLAGTNLKVTDNDIYSSGDVVSTLNNGAAGATYMHIARNRLWNGGTTHWCASRDRRSTHTRTHARVRAQNTHTPNTVAQPSFTTSSCCGCATQGRELEADDLRGQRGNGCKHHGNGKQLSSSQ